MAITYKSQGAGVSTETSGAALSPLCPATVDAGDILIAHVFWEGTTSAPATPSDWSLLFGPSIIQSTIARHWVFGKIAAGTEDGSAIAFGNPAVTTQRAARIYSFAGRVNGSIQELVRGFDETSHATDPAMPTVTTTRVGALAIALVAQNDNNTFPNATGETGGNWVEAVAEYTAALTPGFSIGIQTATPTDNPGTITGGTMATTNDPCGVIGFEIRDTKITISATLDNTSTVEGNLTQAASIAAISGTSAGDSATNGLLKGEALISVTLNNTSTTTGVLIGKGVLSSIINGENTITGTLNGKGVITSTLNVVSTTNGIIKGYGSLIANQNNTSTLTGSLIAKGSLIGSQGNTSTATGSLLGKAHISGSISGISDYIANLQSKGFLSSAFESIASGVTATLKGKGELEGSIEGSSTSTLEYISQGAIYAEISGSSSTDATLIGKGKLMGSIVPSGGSGVIKYFDGSVWHDLSGITIYMG